MQVQSTQTSRLVNPVDKLTTNFDSCAFSPQMQSVSDFFTGLEEGDLEALVEYMVVLTAPKDSYVITANSRPKWWGVVCKGDLSLLTSKKQVVRSLPTNKRTVFLTVGQCPNENRQAGHSKQEK